jgi:hypothetical protein
LCCITRGFLILVFYYIPKGGKAKKIEAYRLFFGRHLTSRAVHDATGNIYKVIIINNKKKQKKMRKKMSVKLWNPRERERVGQHIIYT